MEKFPFVFQLGSHSPPVIRGVPGFDRDEGAATSCGYFVMRNQFAFNNRSVLGGLDYTRHQPNRLVSWRGTFEFYCVVSGNGAGRFVESITFHQKVSGGPVAMAIEQGAGNTTAQHPVKRLLVSFGLKLSDHLFALREAADVKASFVCWPTAKTFEVGSVSFLDTFFVHGRRLEGICRGLSSRAC